MHSLIAGVTTRVAPPEVKEIVYAGKHFDGGSLNAQIQGYLWFGGLRLGRRAALPRFSGVERLISGTEGICGAVPALVSWPGGRAWGVSSLVECGMSDS